MTLQDAVSLIEHDSLGEKKDAQWADLGCGSGLFTYALANCLQKGSSIHAVDKSPIALQKHPNPHGVTIYKKQLDFVHQELPFNGLDGVLMANALHFVANQPHFINSISRKLADNGVFLIVEYDIDAANPWVPHPVNARSLQLLFAKAGYENFSRLGELPSVYHTGNIYATLITK